MRALLVDDSRTTRMLIGKIVSALGFETSEAADGQQAIEQLAQSTFDLVLLDWNMPVMNGLECLRQLRSNPKWSDIKVIMVTTETEIQQVVKAIDNGANEYIMKPFTGEMFKEKLSIIGLDPPAEGGFKHG